MCARARARPAEPDGVSAGPSIARSCRGPAAPPPTRPGEGPTRPPPLMELSAIGEQVFAVESIRKKRVRKVRLLGGGSRDAARSPPAPQHRPLQAGQSGKWCGAHLGTLRCLARWSPEPAPHFVRHRVGPVELKLLPRDAGASESTWDGDEDGD